MRRICGFLLVLALGAILVGQVPKALSDSPQPAAGVPVYDEQGSLKRPVGYETWVHVGTDLGLSYSPELPTRRASERGAAQHPGDFHNVYLEPKAYAEYIKTGKFPDPTMLVMTVHEGRDKDGGDIVTRGVYQGKLLAVEAALKNTARPDGSKTDWAYYGFPGNQQTAKAFPDRACYDCHLKHADDDNVWVQFYPVLRDRKEK